MSAKEKPLLAIYVEGETKTGKGAASEAIATALKLQGVAVYFDVAGDFFRRFTAIIRRELDLSPSAPLPDRERLAEIATELYKNRKAFAIDPSLGDLQRPEISNCVSQLGELPIAQEAAIDWYEQSVVQARQAEADVLVLDGRNPRHHVEALNQDVVTILDIYMICEPTVAAERVLLSAGNSQPTDQQLRPIIDNITNRRALDRQRPEWPFWWPEQHLAFTPGQDSVDQAISATHLTAADSPLPLVIDNSHVPKQMMWDAVEALALAAYNGR
ncbi:MAG: hypothetical protein ABIV43_02680 [Candidatus Saccharimonadales bacterium]